MGLLPAYALGVAIPFLIAAVMPDQFAVSPTRIRPWLPRFERANGVPIRIIAALLFADSIGCSAELETWSPL